MRFGIWFKVSVAVSCGSDHKVLQTELRKQSKCILLRWGEQKPEIKVWVGQGRAGRGRGGSGSRPARLRLRVSSAALRVLASGGTALASRPHVGSSCQWLCLGGLISSYKEPGRAGLRPTPLHPTLIPAELIHLPGPSFQIGPPPSQAPGFGTWACSLWGHRSTPLGVLPKRNGGGWQ